MRSSKLSPVKSLSKSGAFSSDASISDAQQKKGKRQKKTEKDERPSLYL